MMFAQDWLIYLTLAFGLGIAGQFIRVGVGLKKMYDKVGVEGAREAFDSNKLIISLGLGALAAVLTACVQWEAVDQLLDREFMFTLMAAGYAGSDIIEGLIEHRIMPK